MPIIWINFPTGSSPEVAARHDKPKALKKFVSEIVTKADRRAKLIDLYFEVGSGYACALIRDLDDYIAVKAVTNVLGADGATKLLNAAQAEEAIKRQGTLT